MDNSNLKHYISQIQVNKDDNVEKSIEIYERLVQWLNDNLLPETNLFPSAAMTTTDDISIVFYAILITEIYWKMHKNALTERLPEKLKTTCTEIELENGPLNYFVEKLLNTKNGYQYLPVLQYYFKMCLNIERFNDILKSIQNKIENYSTDVKEQTIFYADQDNSERNETSRLIEKVFKLKNDDISIAIDRLIKYLPFENIAWVFLTNTRTNLIIQYEICKKLENSTIDESFLKAMFDSCSRDDKGLNQFYKLLTNENFARYLVNYFIEVLKKASLEEGHTEKDSFKEVSFLIGACLSNKSPIRVEFYKLIQSEEIDSNLLFYINDMKFIYDY